MNGKGKKSSTSPQSRTHAWLKERGWIFGKTEQSITIPDPTSPTGKRLFKRDLFGFVDVVAVHSTMKGVLFLQVTGGMNNKFERLKKINEAPATIPILQAGNTIEFQAWRKLGPRGRKRWAVYRCQARLDAGRIVWVDMNEENDDDDFATQAALFPSPGTYHVPA